MPNKADDLIARDQTTDDDNSKNLSALADDEFRNLLANAIEPNYSKSIEPDSIYVDQQHNDQLLSTETTTESVVVGVTAIGDRPLLSSLAKQCLLSLQKEAIANQTAVDAESEAKIKANSYIVDSVTPTLRSKLSKCVSQDSSSMMFDTQPIHVRTRSSGASVAVDEPIALFSSAQSHRNGTTTGELSAIRDRMIPFIDDQDDQQQYAIANEQQPLLAGKHHHNIASSQLNRAKVLNVEASNKEFELQPMKDSPTRVDDDDDDESISMYSDRFDGSGGRALRKRNTTGSYDVSETNNQYIDHLQPTKVYQLQQLQFPVDDAYNTTDLQQRSINRLGGRHSPPSEREMTVSGRGAAVGGNHYGTKGSLTQRGQRSYAHAIGSVRNSRKKDNRESVIDVSQLPGYMGELPVDQIVTYIEGTKATNNNTVRCEKKKKTSVGGDYPMSRRRNSTNNQLIVGGSSSVGNDEDYSSSQHDDDTQSQHDNQQQQTSPKSPSEPDRSASTRRSSDIVATVTAAVPTTDVPPAVVKPSYSSIASRRPHDFIDDQMVKQPQTRTAPRNASSLQTSRAGSPDHSPAIHHYHHPGNHHHGHHYHSATITGARGNQSYNRSIMTASSPDSYLCRTTNNHTGGGQMAKALISPPLPPSSSKTTATSVEQVLIGVNDPPLPSSSSSSGDAIMTPIPSLIPPGGRSWADIAKSSKSPRPASETDGRDRSSPPTDNDDDAFIDANTTIPINSADVDSLSTKCSESASTGTIQLTDVKEEENVVGGGVGGGGSAAADTSAIDDDDTNRYYSQGAFLILPNDDSEQDTTPLEGISFFYDPSEPTIVANPGDDEQTPSDNIYDDGDDRMHVPSSAVYCSGGGDSDELRSIEDEDSSAAAYRPTQQNRRLPSTANEIMSTISYEKKRADAAVSTETVTMTKTYDGRLEWHFDSGRTVSLTAGGAQPTLRVDRDRLPAKHSQMAGDLADHWSRFISGVAPIRYKDVANGRRVPI